MTWNSLRNRAISAILAIGITMAIVATTLGAPKQARADSWGYCNTLVAGGFAPCAQGIKRLYNFNRNLMGVNAIAVCATVGDSVVADPTAGIYGSGCGTNTNRYSFCHAPIGTSRHAWVSHTNGGANHTLAGLAVNGLGSCDPIYQPYFTSGDPLLARLAAETGSDSAGLLGGDFRALASKAVKLPPAVEALASLETGNATKARAVGPNSDVYLIAGATLTCIGRAFDDAGPGAIVTCADTAGYADKPRLAFSASGDGRTTVWGAVPDGVSAVTVNTASGPVAARVQNNGIAVTVQKPKSVSVESSGAVQTVVISLAASATN
ncbi:MAG: hypothetical protein WC558_07160 [Patulibacter sp.]